MGDDGQKMGWRSGLLQDFQIPADFLPDLLQLHDPRPLRGETQSRHQATLSDQLPLQVARQMNIGRLLDTRNIDDYPFLFVSETYFPNG